MSDLLILATVCETRLDGGLRKQPIEFTSAILVRSKDDALRLVNFWNSIRPFQKYVLTEARTVTGYIDLGGDHAMERSWPVEGGVPRLTLDEALRAKDFKLTIEKDVP